jgi:hypothetical protein
VLLLLAAALHVRRGRPRLLPLALATGLVVTGGLLVTFLANVPLNDELATVDLTAPPDVLAQAREDDEDPWNAWNIVRTVACAAALTATHPRHAPTSGAHCSRIAARSSRPRRCCAGRAVTVERGGDLLGVLVGGAECRGGL